jgi:hypothetical protein
MWPFEENQGTPSWTVFFTIQKVPSRTVFFVSDFRNKGLVMLEFSANVAG